MISILGSSVPSRIIAQGFVKFVAVFFQKLHITATLNQRL